MGDFPKQIAELRAQTQENWYEFLKVELLSCFNAIDFGDTELRRGERDVAAKEIRSAEKGYENILRYLPQLDSEERRHEIEAELPRLRAVVDALRNKLGAVA